MPLTPLDQMSPPPPEGLLITRRQPYVLLRFTCELCGAKHAIWRLPGKAPKYCPPGPGEKMSQCQKKANVLRVQRHRASKGRG